MIYFITIGIGAVIMLVRGTNGLNLSVFALYIIAALSIALNDVPAFFSPWRRLVVFIVLTVFVSPLLRSSRGTALKAQILVGYSYLFTLVTIISTVMFFMGLGFFDFQDGSPNYYFQGLTTQSMIMGPVAAISCLFCCFQICCSKKRLVKILSLVVLLGGVLCVLQSGSRIAFAAIIAAILAFLLTTNRDRKGRLIKNIAIILTLVALSSPLWMRYTNRLLEKNSSSTSYIDLRSRELSWKQRIVEWKSSPIYGIGFQTVDPNAAGSIVRADNGGVETGTSWLAILSMTGIVGLICFLIIYVRALSISFQISKKRPYLGGYLSSILVFFGIHMFAEGYVYAAGNALCCMLWLILGVAYGLDDFPDYQIELEDKLVFGD